MINSTTVRSRAMLLLFVATVILTGCALGSGKNEVPAAYAQATGVVPQQFRITDQRIIQDRQILDSVQQRLRKLNEAGVVQNNYSLAKAQCWLDTAKSQYHENDRTGYIEESLTEAVKIVQALEADKLARAGFDTPLVARSSKLREDLWMQLSDYKKQSASMACNARTIACAEVRLVRAGHADEQTGWRQAAPYIQMVEDDLRRAKIEADSCVQPRVRMPVAAVAMPADAATVIVSRETYVLMTDTLFKFNKSGAADMIPGGIQRLDDVVQRLKAYKSIQTLTVLGYTDRLGSDAYNDKLSEARAKTVQAYLQSRGVTSATVLAQGKGKRDVISKGCSVKLSYEDLIQCLQPDRRVTIEASGIVK